MPERVTHTTITRYRYSGPETHGHTSYVGALAFAQSRMAVNGTGNVSVTINRLETNGQPDGVWERWIETVGGIR